MCNMTLTIRSILIVLNRFFLSARFIVFLFLIASLDHTPTRARIHSHTSVEATRGDKNQ